MLSDLLAQAANMAADPGLELPERFVAARGKDQRLIRRFTGSLPGLFAAQSRPFATLRQIGLLGLDACLPAKTAFARRAMGLTGTMTPLERGAFQ